MAALQDALKTLAPTEFISVPTNDSANLKSFLSTTFADAQLLIDSIPIPPPDNSTLAPTIGRSRSDTISSMASTSSEISISSARPSPPASDVEALQKEWGRPMKLNPRDNPLGMNVYKLAGKDGKGAWFARRSVHEGLGFQRWKAGLEREFPETMKVQGEPGEGNIRGIGGERRVEFKEVPGVGRMEVYHLSAQFPGPTAPRDFVTLLLTSDSALSNSCGGLSEDKEIPRHFMVVSKPCIHPDTPEREGFVRGQYQSIEFIREIPLRRARKKSASTSNLLEKSSVRQTRNRSNSSALGREAVLRNASQMAQNSDNREEQEQPRTVIPDSSLTSDLNGVGGGRVRGKTISYSESKGPKGENWDVGESEEEDGRESNPVEWIMLTRSDPGGSVPRFMVERGTPGSIVADATKFLNWACSMTLDDLEDEVSPEPSLTGEVAGPQEVHEHNHHYRDTRSLLNYQTNGHLAGLDGVREEDEPALLSAPKQQQSANGTGLYGMLSGAVSAAQSAVAANTPAVILDHLPGHAVYSTKSSTDIHMRPKNFSSRNSISSIDSSSSVGTFTSALETYDLSKIETKDGDTTSNQTDISDTTRSPVVIAHEKELQRLEDRKRKLDEKLAKARERELSRTRNDAEKEEQNLAKVAERHQREVAKQEEKYKREVAKLEAKNDKEARKAEEKKRKAIERDEKVRMTRELEEVKAEKDMLRKEMELLRVQVGELQAENTLLIARLGKLGTAGETMLKDVRTEVSGGGRVRASSIKGMLTPSLSKSTLIKGNSGLGKQTSNVSELTIDKAL